MGIPNNQLLKKTEEIVKEHLQNGRYPSFSTIRAELSKWLRDFELGAPRFKFLPIRRKTNTNFEQFNKELLDIEDDIRDAYEVSIQQHNALTKNFSQGEVERARIQHELNTINDEINELLLTTRNRNVYVKQQALNFFDMTNINNQKTDALINVQQGEVRLKEQDRFSRKVPLIDKMPSLSVSQNYKSSVTVSPYKSAFDDYLNTAWLERIFTDRLNDKKQMDVHLTIPVGKEEVNLLSLTPHHTKEVYVSLSYTEDDASWINLQDYTRVKISETTEFSFDNIKPHKIRITFTKYGYDEEDQNGFYYYFGAKDISLYRRHYEERSTIQLLPVELDENTKTIHVEGQGSTPNNTKVTYYAAIHGNLDEEELTWQKVSESKAFADNVDTPIIIETTDREYETSRKVIDSGEIINGMRVYKLVKMDGNSLFAKDFLGGIQNVKLYRGVGKWKREAGYKAFDGNIPMLGDWIAFQKEKGDTIKTDFLTRGNQLSFESSKRNFYAFTMCVWADTNESRPMTIDLYQLGAIHAKNKLGTYSVYCNQERLLPSNDEVDLRLTKGWNEIQIFVHVGDLMNRRDLPDELFPYSMAVGKLDITSFRTQRAELQPLMQTSKENLFHNIPANNSKYFAMENNEIFINHYLEDIEYQCVFEGRLEMDTRYVTIKAELERDTAYSHITPIINKMYVKTI